MELISLAPCLVVFAGPPASGKSTLSKAAAAMITNAELLEMDQVRLDLLPGPIHDKERRCAAYRVIHFKATTAVLGRKVAILDATYMPPESREELAQISSRLRVPVFVIQAWATGEEAAKRFRLRTDEHAGADLTSSRVKDLADKWVRFDGAPLIETSSLSDEDARIRLRKLIESPSPTNVVRWTNHDYQPDPRQGPAEPRPSTPGKKISHAGMQTAKWILISVPLRLVLIGLFIMVGVLPMLIRVGGFYLESYRSEMASAASDRRLRYFALVVLCFAAFSLRRRLVGTLLSAFRDARVRLPTLARSIVKRIKSQKATLISNLLLLGVVVVGLLVCSKTIYHGFALPQVLALISTRNPKDLSAWATFCFAALAIVTGLIGLWKHWKPDYDEAKLLRSTGGSVRFEGAIKRDPTDAEIYFAYRSRMVGNHALDLPAIPEMPLRGTPIYFLIQPRPGVSFDALVNPRGCPVEYRNDADAGERGFSWNEFCDWAVRARGREYYKRWSREWGVRCVYADWNKDGAFLIDATKSAYTEYVCREHAVNLSAIGVLPDLRSLLEGGGWDSGELDLRKIREAASRYSMRVAVASLLLTSDNYFVFQRRSDSVATGAGNLVGSATGASDWYADRPKRGWGPQNWSLGNSVRRETKEEIGVAAFGPGATRGVPPKEKPFIGAAFNLRYGRDLNFYACYEVEMRAEDVAEAKSHARDRWEIASLAFLPQMRLTKKAFLSGELDTVLPNRSRHLNGLLYAWMRYAGRWD